MEFFSYCQVVKNRQKKKASLVVQGIFLAYTKNWANKEFNFYVLLFMINLLLTQKWVDTLFLWFVVHGGNFIGGTEMGTRILMSFPRRFCNQKLLIANVLGTLIGHFLQSS